MGFRGKSRQNQIQEIENVKRDQQEELEKLLGETTRTYPKEAFEYKIAQLQQDIEAERQKHDDHIRKREVLERELEYIKEENDRLIQRGEYEEKKHKESIPSALKKRRVMRVKYFFI